MSANAHEDEGDVVIRPAGTIPIKLKQSENQWVPVITVTDAVEMAGIDPNASIRFDPQMYEETGGFIPAIQMGGPQSAMTDGRGDELMRSILVEGAENNPAYRITLPPVVLDKLGIPREMIKEAEESGGKVFVNVFAGDEMIAISRADPVHLDIDLDAVSETVPEGVDPNVWFGMPQVMRDDYRKVEIEGVDPQEIADQRGIEASTIKQNVSQAAARISAR